MGMYTQVRGWLNVDSIGYERFYKIRRLLEKAKDDFEDDDAIIDADGCKASRKWVCRDTIAHKGGNGSGFLFIGTELKNYGLPAETWIRHLLKYFPNAEGRIDFQYEQDALTCKCWKIAKGKVLSEYQDTTWCKGYGNSFEIK